MNKERNKIVLLTGATRGLGLSLTERMIDAGHTVWCCGRSESSFETQRRRWAAPHAFETVDVTDMNRVQSWLSPLIGSHGAPGLLLNNAGVINVNAPLWEVPEEEFSYVIDVHLKGSANLIRAAVPSMIQRGSGVIVNFSSTWGRSASRDVAPYCAAKWGIEGLTRALALDLPAGLAAVSLNPGIINTDMLRSCLPDMAPGCPSPEDWSRGMVEFLMQIGPSQNGNALTAP